MTLETGMHHDASMQQGPLLVGSRQVSSSNLSPPAARVEHCQTGRCSCTPVAYASQMPATSPPFNLHLVPSLTKHCKHCIHCIPCPTSSIPSAGPHSVFRPVRFTRSFTHQLTHARFSRGRVGSRFFSHSFSPAQYIRFIFRLLFCLPLLIAPLLPNPPPRRICCLLFVFSAPTDIRPAPTSASFLVP